MLIWQCVIFSIIPDFPSQFIFSKKNHKESKLTPKNLFL
jgi:hypothetical protein